nr:gluconate:H+ symporter [Phaeacidiphilus oryzae]
MRLLADAATAPPASHNHTQLIIAALAGFAVIIAVIGWLKLHPFLALTVGTGVMTLVAGVPLANVFDSFASGLGATVASTGVLIALGAILGRLLADSGGADQIVDTILARSSKRTIPWAMALIAALIGLPLFFEIGIVMLIPVVVLVVRRGNYSMLRVGIPALAGLSVLHGLIPPHPGPLAAISSIHADLGTTIALGLVVAIPTVIIAGPVFSRFADRWAVATPPAALATTADERAEEGDAPARRPSFGATICTVLLPVVLMLGKALADVLDSNGHNAFRSTFDFLGAPLTALLLAVLLAMFTLGRPAGFTRGRISEVVEHSLGPIAGIVLIVGAGGGFKQALVDIGISKMISDWAVHLHFSALLLAWLVAVLIRITTGSATVATITAAGIVSPLAAGMSGPHTALLVLAVGAGSLFFSHVNDAGFWLVKGYFGMSVKDTLKTWSVMETIISVVAIVIILLLGLVV